MYTHIYRRSWICIHVYVDVYMCIHAYAYMYIMRLRTPDAADDASRTESDKRKRKSRKHDRSTSSCDDRCATSDSHDKTQEQRSHSRYIHTYI